MEIRQMLEASLLANHRGIVAKDDEDVGLLVKYIGAGASGTVEVTTSTGDITFKHGALSSEVVDTTIDSGGPSDPGVIDVSETNSNTMGEVVDLINASANWEAKLVGCLRADVSTAMLLVKGETQAKVTGGIKLYRDTSSCINISLAIDRSIFKGIEADNDNWINSVLKIISTNTFNTLNAIQIYDINREDKTEVLIFQRSGGATGVEQDLPAAGSFFQIDSSKGGYLLIRMISTAACTGILTVLGKQVNYINPDY